MDLLPRMQVSMPPAADRQREAGAWKDPTWWAYAMERGVLKSLTGHSDSISNGANCYQGGVSSRPQAVVRYTGLTGRRRVVVGVVCSRVGKAELSESWLLGRSHETAGANGTEPGCGCVEATGEKQGRLRVLY
jgi:hypothetical protein